jgi:hypothetical protein
MTTKYLIIADVIAVIKLKKQKDTKNIMSFTRKKEKITGKPTKK